MEREEGIQLTKCTACEKPITSKQNYIWRGQNGVIDSYQHFCDHSCLDAYDTKEAEETTDVE